MATMLPSSGRLSLSQVVSALGLQVGGGISMGSELLRAMAGKRGGPISLSDFYGAGKLECFIRAGDDDNGNARGYYQSFWGENDSPQLGSVHMLGVFDSFDVPGNKFVFAVEGAHTADAFRAIVINNKIYYQGDEDVLVYNADSNTTVWEWHTRPADLQSDVVYELTMLIGPSSSSAPVEPEATLPEGGGTDWSLVFEDNFNDAGLNSSKWNDALWYLRSQLESAPKNYDIFDGKLRIWPLQHNDTWIQRDLTTFGKFDQVRGFWEVRLKMPVNKGCRIGFWLMNHDTDARPIIVGFQSMTSHSAESGWVDSEGRAQDFSIMVQPATDGQVLLSRRYLDIERYEPQPLTQEFFTFGIYKDETHLRFYINGHEWRSQEITGPNAMTLRQYLVLSLDYINDHGGPDGTTVQDATGAVEIEYVRAWQPGAGSSIPNPDPDPDPDPDPGTGGPVIPPPPDAHPNYIPPYGRLAVDYPYMTFREEFNSASGVSDQFAASNGADRMTIENSTLSSWPEPPVPSTALMLNTENFFRQKHGLFEIRFKGNRGRSANFSVGLRYSKPNPDTGFGVYLDATIGHSKRASAYDVNGRPISLEIVYSSSRESLTMYRGSQDTAVGHVPVSTEWQTVAIEWTPGVMSFFANGVLMHTREVSQSNPPMWLQINLSQMLAAQGEQNAFFPGVSNSIMIDYIRAWGSKDNTAIIEGSLPPLPYDQGGKGSGTTPVGRDIVMFVGNSTTWGYRSNVGTQVAKPYPAAFADLRTDHVIQNRGVNSSQTTHWINGTGGVGDTFANIMASSTGVRYVCLDFGTLEQFDMTPAEFRESLKTMIAEVRKVPGRVPVLITPFIADFTGLANYAQAVRDTGSEVGVVVIDKYKWSRDLVNASGRGVRTFVPDGVHPNEQMYIDGGHFVAREWEKVTGHVPPVTPPDPDPGDPDPPDPTSPMPAVPADHPHAYDLVFNEEFNGSDLNYNIWNPRIWWNPDEDAGAKNWQVSGGELHIWPQRSADGKWRYRTIDTDGKYYQTYGFFECEAKLCVGRGTWPAFWLYNHDGSLRPEIDIMEAYSGGGPDTGQYWANANLEPIDYGMTLWRIDGQMIAETKMNHHHPSVVLSDAYYKYGALWEPDGVTFFFDGKQMGPKMMTDFFTYRMYILLDVYLGSASGTPNEAETPQGIGNSFSVKYVRAWRKR